MSGKHKDWRGVSVVLFLAIKAFMLWNAREMAIYVTLFLGRYGDVILNHPSISLSANLLWLCFRHQKRLLRRQIKRQISDVIKSSAINQLLQR